MLIIISSIINIATKLNLVSRLAENICNYVKQDILQVSLPVTNTGCDK